MYAWYVGFGRRTWSGWQDNNCELLEAETRDEALKKFFAHHQGEKCEVWIIEQIKKKQEEEHVQRV